MPTYLTMPRRLVDRLPRSHSIPTQPIPIHSNPPKVLGHHLMDEGAVAPRAILLSAIRQRQQESRHILGSTAPSLFD
jgi:hypothetical protein